MWKFYVITNQWYQLDSYDSRVSADSFLIALFSEEILEVYYLQQTAQSFVEDLGQSDTKEIPIWIMETDATDNCNTYIHVVMRSNTAKTYKKK